MEKLTKLCQINIVETKETAARVNFLNIVENDRLQEERQFITMLNNYYLSQRFIQDNEDNYYFTHADHYMFNPNLSIEDID